MSEPLRNLLKKDIPFQWPLSQKTAFENIKQLICRGISLTYFDPYKKTVVQVDASLRRLRSALVQEGKVIAFASRALTDTEKRYANIERVMLAVVVACEISLLHIWQAIYSGVGVQAPRNDSFDESTAAPPRFQRMLRRIQGYDMTVKYKRGTEMLLTDPMSRLSPLLREDSLNPQEVCLA